MTTNLKVRMLRQLGMERRRTETDNTDKISALSLRSISAMPTYLIECIPRRDNQGGAYSPPIATAFLDVASTVLRSRVGSLLEMTRFPDALRGPLAPS